MRVKTFALGITAALGAALAGFAGCNGDVEEATGSGTTGTGGVQSTTATATAVTSSSSGTTTVTGTTTSVPATTSSSSSSGSGGGSPCDMACAHAASCGVNVCQLGGINCATAGSAYDCLAECIDALPCSSLNFTSLAGCQKQCAATSDGGTGPADGGATPDGGLLSGCGGCVAQSCITPALACYESAACKGWITCAQACYTAAAPSVACFQACDAQNPGASTLAAPIYACTCSSCATQCASADPCAAGTDGGP